jgi:hypothetical protein
MEDSALIEAAQRGDQLAFERLLRRYQRLLDAHASRFYLPAATPTTSSRRRASAS